MTHPTKHLCPHGVDTRTAHCCQCADPAFHAARGGEAVAAALNTRTMTIGGQGPISSNEIAEPTQSEIRAVRNYPASAITALRKQDTEIKRLREENQSLRNLADNLRPGPISQALQDSPDYSGQTIERLRAALTGLIEAWDFMHIHLTPYPDVNKKVSTARDALSDDGSAPETAPERRYEAQLLAIVNAAAFCGPLPEQFQALQTFIDVAGKLIERDHGLPEETSECRRSGLSEDAAGTGPVDNQAEARLSRREVTAQDGWKCIACDHENPPRVLRCQNPKCPVLGYSSENGLANEGNK